MRNHHFPITIFPSKKLENFYRKKKMKFPIRRVSVLNTGKSVASEGSGFPPCCLGVGGFLLSSLGVGVPAVLFGCGWLPAVLFGWFHLCGPAQQ